jgi:hypothetical protein
MAWERLAYLNTSRRRQRFRRIASEQLAHETQTQHLSLGVLIPELFHHLCSKGCEASRHIDRELQALKQVSFLGEMAEVVEDRGLGLGQSRRALAASV